MIRVLLLCLLLFLPAMYVSGQDFRVPPDFDPDTVRNFARFEPAVIQAADWLMHHPPEKSEQRQEITKFLINWLDKTPTLTIVLDPDIIKFTDCSECVLIFMAAYAKHAIRNPKDTRAEHNVAAVHAVLDYYLKYRKFLPKSKGIKFYLKLDNKGQLDEYIRNNS